MKISQVFKDFKGRKGSQVERRGGERPGRGAGGGSKGVALQTSPATCRTQVLTGPYAGPPEKGGLELGPTRNQSRPDQNKTRIQARNQTRTEPEFELSAKWR